MPKIPKKQNNTDESSEEEQPKNKSKNYKKEDLTIVVKCDNIERMIKYYSKYGKVQYDMNNIDTKYVLILNKYLLNVPYFLNKMFYNYKTISESDDKNVMGYEKNSLEERKIVDNLRFLNEEMWRDK